VRAGGGGCRRSKEPRRFFAQFLSQKKNSQARSVSTTSRALKALAAKQQESSGYDLVIKEHAPPTASARRFLSALRRNRRAIPVVVISSSLSSRADAAGDAAHGDSAAAKCLQAGAADFLVGPLGIDECSNLYARVFWWRRVSQFYYAEKQRREIKGGKGESLRLSFGMALLLKPLVFSFLGASVGFFSPTS